jgi:hypothetical protein
MKPIGSKALFNHNGFKTGYLDRSGVFRDIEGRGLGIKMKHILSNEIVTIDDFATGLFLGRGGHIEGREGRSTGLRLGPNMGGRKYILGR